MNTQRCILVASLIFFTANLVSAQPSSVNTSKEANAGAKNFIKINLLGIPLNNYSFQYEHIVSKRFSLAASYRFMPTSNLPFKDKIADAFDDDDPDTRKTIQNLRIGNFAITPEARLYLGKGYGQGFYLGAFYRFAKFEMDKLPVNYDNTNSIDLSGNLTANTGGILIGAQWSLGKHVALDWFILGPHYGSGKGDFIGIASRPLTPIEQIVLRDNLEDIDVPFADETYNVNSSGATMKLNGPWAGVRSGLSLAVKF